MHKKILSGLLGVLVSVGVLYACGPYFAVFYHTPAHISMLSYDDMEVPFSELDSSEIMIPYVNADVYSLFPIYRKMIDKPLSNAVKKALYEKVPEESLEIKSDQEPYVVIGYKDSQKDWLDERKKYATTTVEYDYWSCKNSAYKTAYEMLKKREGNASKAELTRWVAHQDEVFDACIENLHGDDPVERVEDAHWYSGVFAYFDIAKKRIVAFWGLDIPQEPKDACMSRECLFVVGFTGALQQDYEYQQAAISFYKKDFFKARRQLEVIVGSSDHSWMLQARFSLGRVYLILGDKLRENKIFDEKALEQFRTISSVKEFLGSSASDTAFYKNEANIVVNRIVYSDKDEVLTSSEDVVLLKVVLGSLKKKDLSGDWKKRGDYAQWVHVWLSAKDAKLSDYAFKKYQETKSNAWLLATLRLSQKNDSHFSIIAKTVEELPVTSPIYWNARYYLIKTYIDTGDLAVANELLTSLPKLPNKLLYNYFESLQMLSSNTLVDVFKHSVRYAITTQYVFDGRDQNKLKQVQFMDDRAKALFDRIPLEKQNELFTKDGIVSKEQTELIRLVIFVRAVLQGNYSVADSVATILSRNNSQIGADLKAYLAASDIDHKKFSAVLFMIKYPGVGLWLYDEAVANVSFVKKPEYGFEDTIMPSYKDVSQFNYNRWDYCHPRDYQEIDGEFKAVDLDFKQYVVEMLNFDTLLSKKDVETVKHQYKEMYIIPSNYFAETILSFADKNPADARIPEALAQGVRMSKFETCKDDSSSNYSKRMYELLHKRFPDSVWTKKTTVYY